MRLPVSRTQRRARVGDFATRLTVSIVANLLLAAALLCSYLFNTSLPFAGSSAQGQPEALVQDLRSQLRNVSGTLEDALGNLHEKEESIAAEKASREEERRNALLQVAELQGEKAGLKGQLDAQLALSKGCSNGLDSSGKRWLTIGIPTIPRKNDTDYLTRTLGSLLEEVPLDTTDPMYMRVKVIVMNNRPGAHPVWTKIRDRIQDATVEEASKFVRKGRLYVDFVENPGTVPDPAPDAEEPDDNNNPSNRPGRQVRRQTCDLVSLLETAQPLSHYYVFMEDDFRVCPNMLRVLSYAVRKLNTIPSYGKWLALRFSYGMNGILLHNADLLSLTSYLRKHTARLPPDLLWTEWYAGRRLELRSVTRGRKLAVYRYNLLDHIGARSSFAVRAYRPEWPRCYHPMSDMWSLAKSEKFNERRCPNADIFPCPADDGEEVWTQHPLIWPNITAGSEADHPPVPPDEMPLRSNQTEASRDRQGSRVGALRKVANRRFVDGDVSLSGTS